MELDIWLLKHLDLSFFNVLFQNDLFQWISWDHQYLDLTWVALKCWGRAAASPRFCLTLCKLHLNLKLCCGVIYFLSVTVELGYLALLLSTVSNKCSISFTHRGKRVISVFLSEVTFPIKIYPCLLVHLILS